MQIAHLARHAALATACGALIVPVFARGKGDPLTGLLAEIDAALGGELGNLIADAGFVAKRGATLSASTMGRIAARRVILAGLGSEAGLDEEALRAAYGAASSAARDSAATVVVAVLPDDGAETLKHAVTGASMASYRYLKHKGTHGGDAPRMLTSIAFASDLDPAMAAAAIGQASAVASAVAFARDLVNEPASVLHPVEVADHAMRIAAEHSLEIEVLAPSDMARLGMGGILGVGKGSAIEPRMIRLTYRPAHPTADSRTIGLVGKCITFDTGGYSIKTFDGMLDMKTDMSGGAAVLGVMTALSAVGCPHTVHAVICAAENMISGDAFRPGDILTAMNGVTMEILSTDAEGRLVLADGMVWAAQHGAEEMVDVATLTGAAVVALGEGTTALFANNDVLAGRLLAASKQAGESVWRMPLSEHLEELIKGEVGDIKNTGGRYGGAITAALFLQHFAEGKAWAHLDIAGTARSSKQRPYTPKGATGVMVRTLINYVLN